MRISIMGADPDALLTIQYFKDTYEASTNAMRYDSALLWRSVIRHDMIQYNAKQLYDAMQFNMLAIPPPW